MERSRDVVVRHAHCWRLNHDPGSVRWRHENPRTWVAVECFIAYVEAVTSGALCSAIDKFGCFKPVAPPLVIAETSPILMQILLVMLG
jgi:hypothetical protein